MALARIRSTRRRSTDLRRIELLDAVPALSPGYERPAHMGPYAERLSRAVGASLTQVLAAPPQHGKTELTLAGLLWLMARNPGRRFAYVTYNQHRSDQVQRRAKRLAEAAGFEPIGTQRHWYMPNGSELIWTSIEGGLTGSGIDGVLVIDDPIKGPVDAASPIARERAWDWLQSVGMDRVHPEASVFVMATRWHVDDLSGRCIKRLGWPYLNLQAICDSDDDPLGRQPGEPLWPTGRPLEHLQRVQRTKTPYWWAAQYQGQPRPKGGEVFGEPHWYDALPMTGYKIGYGLDCAYTEKTKADWSVLVRGIAAGGKLYIDEVWRSQLEAPAFAEVVKRALREKPGRVMWHAGGTEKGVAQFLRALGIPVIVRTARADPFQHAQPVAAAWGAGDVLLPSGTDHEWVPDFLDEVGDFTGNRGQHDDQVVALASLFDLLMPLASVKPGAGVVVNRTHSAFRTVA